MAKKKKKQEQLDILELFTGPNTTFTPVQETAHEAKVRQDKEQKEKDSRKLWNMEELRNGKYDAGELIIKPLMRLGKNQITDIKDSFKKSDSLFTESWDWYDVPTTVKQVSKTVLGTGARFAGKKAVGISSGLEQFSDFGENALGYANHLLGRDEQAYKHWANADYNSTQGMVNDVKRLFIGDFAKEKSDEEANKEFDDKYKWFYDNSILSKKGEDKVQEIARMETIIAMGAIMSGGAAPAGASSTELAAANKAMQIGNDLAFFMSTQGQAINEARASGASPLQALLYGNANALIETGTEKMFGGLGKLSDVTGVSKGLADNFVNKFSSKISNTLVKNAVNLGIDINGEGFEELAAGFLDAFAKKFTHMNQTDLKQLMKDENLMDSYIQGATTSFFMARRARFCW